MDACKVGRGVSYNGTNCKARIGALRMSPEWLQAEAALEAIRQPTEEMLAAGTRGSHSGEYVGLDGIPRHTDAERVWFPMIDAALAPNVSRETSRTPDNLPQDFGSGEV